MTLGEIFVRPARHVRLASVKVVRGIVLARAKLVRLENFYLNPPVPIVRQIPSLVQEALMRASADVTLALQAQMVDLANSAMQESSNRPPAMVIA